VTHAQRLIHASIVVVSDRQALEACKAFMLDHRVVVEPACGGVTATIEQLKKWKSG
jgi:L-serine/L-threonine ammonia-lyase